MRNWSPAWQALDAVDYLSLCTPSINSEPKIPPVAQHGGPSLGHQGASRHTCLFTVNRNACLPGTTALFTQWVNSAVHRLCGFCYRAQGHVLEERLQTWDFLEPACDTPSSLLLYPPFIDHHNVAYYESCASFDLASATSLTISGCMPPKSIHPT